MGKEKFDIPHSLIQAAVDGNEEARTEFIVRAEFYLSNYIKFNSKKWSLASHPYIEDFLYKFLISMWRNPGRWLKSKNPVGHILFFFKYEAWSMLVYKRFFEDKLEIVKESLDEIDLLDYHPKDDTIQIVDLFVDISIYVANAKKPVYILDEQWRQILKEVHQYFKILKEDEYGVRQHELGAFAEELVYHISGTLLDKRRIKPV